MRCRPWADSLTRLIRIHLPPHASIESGPANLLCHSQVPSVGELYMAETTVRTHLGRFLTKLGLRDRVQAVVVAYETGLARPGAP